MDIKIGETIKKLRKERDVTQEKLADYLGISYQAVSKWENGTALPDITLVVPLANFFGVGTDELFSQNKQITDEKIQEYEEKSRKLFNLGDMKSCISLMRKALEEYPKNYRFMLTLARAIQWNQYNQAEDNDAKSKENEEIVEFCERILEDCADTNTRNGTMQILCTAYKDLGQREKAIKTAEEMPSFSATRDWLLSSLCEGDRQIKQKQGNILFCIWYAAYELTELAHKLGGEEKIAHLEAALKLHETIFYDGNALYYHTWIFGICLELARCYAAKDAEKAVEYLLMAEKHAAANDAVPEEFTRYTSIFVNQMGHSTANTLKSSTETSRGQFLNWLNGKDWEQLSGNSDFAALKERLAKS